MANDELDKVELPAIKQLKSLGWIYVKGEELNEAEIRDILEYTEYKTIEEIDKDLRWYELLQLDLDDSLYIRKMLERKEPLSSKPRVKLSTIHAAKGGEADNVLLVLDMSKRTLESLQRSLEKQDEEHRVWYVGVTRTKQNLYIMAAKKEDQGYEIEGLG